MQPGIEAFIQNMTELGFETTLEAELVICRVVALDGAFAGRPVETGVAIGELEPWPHVPPHWLHFPGSVRFCADQQPTLSKVWMVDAQPSDNRGGVTLPLESRGLAMSEQPSVRRSRDASNVGSNDRRRSRRRSSGGLFAKMVRKTSVLPLIGHPRASPVSAL